jgi:hypothetical protein
MSAARNTAQANSGLASEYAWIGKARPAPYDVRIGNWR